MKSLKYKILFVILFMTIGIAAVTTNLITNGSTNIASNPDDFNVYFSRVKDYGDTDSSYVDANVSVYSDKKIVFTGVLKNLRERIGIDVDVTNASKNYDADVKFLCTSNSSYLLLDYGINSETIRATETVTGGIVVNLVKTYTGDTDLEVEISCTMTATAVERTSQGSGGVNAPLETYFDVGAEVSLGREKFNVISDNGNTVTMLAQYNISSNTYNQTTDQMDINFSNRTGWEYTPGPKDIDVQTWGGDAKTVLNNYVSYLNTEYGVDVTGNLITVLELGDLGCTISDNYSYGSDVLSCKDSEYSDWLVNGQYWWTRSAYSIYSSDIFVMANSGNLGNYIYDETAGVRPLITIKKEAVIPSLITFSLVGKSYTAERYMTMIDWVYSEYNTDGKFRDYNSANCNTSLITDGGAPIVYENGDRALCTTVISDGDSFSVDSSEF